MLDQYAVIGNPVSHSKSPLIHTRFAKQTGQKLNYSALFSDMELFQESVQKFIENNGKGLNVTVPFKQQAWQLVNERSTMAKKAGAVNTIIVKEQNYLIGENTDGLGLVSDLKNNLNFSLRNKKILVMGAGGAVRGVLGPLLNEAPEKLIIANRTAKTAVELQNIFGDDGNVEGFGYEKLEKQNFDLVINGTAASLQGDLPPVSLTAIDGALCYDMMYAPEDTVFMAWAKANGAAQVCDGLGMLVEQAAESFYLWRKIRPDAKAVISFLQRQ